MNASYVSQNIVYRNPTIRMLGRTISDLVANGAGGHDKANDDLGSNDDVIRSMEDMVKEFTRSFPTHQPSLPLPEKEGVLVTGTTGSLGSHLLHVLLITPSVAKIYALNRLDRNGNLAVRDRQKKAFKEHGLDVSLLDSPKLVLLEGDTSLRGFGLPQSGLDDMARSVTTIIHNGKIYIYYLP